MIRTPKWLANQTHTKPHICQCLWLGSNWIELIKGSIIVTVKLWKLKDQKCATAIWPLTHNNNKSVKRSRALEKMIKQSSTFFLPIKTFDPVVRTAQTLQQPTYKWLPLAKCYCALWPAGTCGAVTLDNFHQSWSPCAFTSKVVDYSL